MNLIKMRFMRSSAFVNSLSPSWILYLFACLGLRLALNINSISYIFSGYCPMDGNLFFRQVHRTAVWHAEVTVDNLGSYLRLQYIHLLWKETHYKIWQCF